MSKTLTLFWGMVVFAVAGCATQVFTAQEPPQEGPRTKLEALAAQEGVLLILGSSRVGEMQGFRGGLIRLECKEFKEAGSGRREAGVAIALAETSKPGTEYFTFVDEDELDSVVRAVEFFSKVTASVTSLDEYKVLLRTRGGLQLSLRTIRAGEGVRVACDDGSGSVFSVYLSPKDLPGFKDLLLLARERIKAL